MNCNNLGLISIVASWAGLLFMIWYWKGDIAKTFSQNAARQRSSIIYYALLWLVCLPPLVWFLMVPLYEALGLTPLFRLIAGVASISMFIAALVPETKNWKAKVHRSAALTMARCFMPLVLLISLSPVISTLAQTISIIALLFMIFSAYQYHRNGPNHPKLLIGQGMYIVAFQVSIIFAYYF